MQDFADSVAQGAKKQGQDVLGNFNPTQTQQGFLKSYNAMNVGQQGQTSDYSKRFADSIAANPTATDYLKQGNEMFGVEPLTQQANYLNTQVTNAYPNAVKQARGFDYSQGQVDANVNQNLRFLSPQATAATNQAQVAQQLAGQYADRGLQQTDINLRPVTAEQQFILQQQGNEAQAFLQSNAQEMQGLVAKLQAGVQLTQAEYDRYNQMLQAEASVRNAQTAAQASRDVANISAGASRDVANIGNQFQQVKSGDNLVNTFAGTIMNPSMLSAKTGVAQYGR